MDKALFLAVPSDFSFALGICFGVFAESSLYHTGEGLRENSSFSEERETSEKAGNPALLSLDIAFSGTACLSFGIRPDQKYSADSGRRFCQGIGECTASFKKFL